MHEGATIRVEDDAERETGLPTALTETTEDAADQPEGGRAVEPAAVGVGFRIRPGGTARLRPAPRDRRTLATVETLFAVQSTPRDDLPDPAQIARDLARCVVEILAGARELDQIARWLTDEVQRNLQQRVLIATRARSVRRQPPQRPVFSIGSVLIDEPASGIAEATVIVHGKARTRAVAIRLEGLDGRWRATAISVL